MSRTGYNSGRAVGDLAHCADLSAVASNYVSQSTNSTGGEEAVLRASPGNDSGERAKY